MASTALSRQGKNAPEAVKDWEDEYRREKTNHNALKVRFNEQDDHIKKLQAKIRKLENDFIQIDRQRGGPGPTKPRDREEEDLIVTLYDQISKLKGQNALLVDKNKQLVEQLERKKREITLAKRPTNPQKQAVLKGKQQLHQLQEVDIVAAQTVLNTQKASAKKLQAIDPEFPPPPNATDSNLLEIARKYKARLSVAEEQLEQFREENNRLKATSAAGHSGSPSKSTQQSHTPDPQLESQLRDAGWRLQQLQTQYDYLASKSASQGQAYKHLEEQLEEYTHKVRDLRRALEDLRHEKEISDSKALRANELEETVADLRQVNRSLEDKIARLCETPFISDAFGQQEQRMRLEDAAREREELKIKVMHLTEAVRTHFSALTSLKQHAAELREEKDTAERKVEEMKSKYQKLESDSSLLQDKLRLYSGDDGVDVAQLEQALTMVKRREKAFEKLPFLEQVDGEAMLSLPSVKRKLEEVQMINLRQTEEVERLESMLKLQSGINRDLHKELEAMVHKTDKDKKELLQRAQDFEEMALRRLEKVHSLEAQLRQMVYGVAKGGKKLAAGAHQSVGIMDAASALSAHHVETSSVAPSDENLLLNDLIDEKEEGDLMPDENLLEIWVRGCDIRDGATTAGSSTFVVIDFFDYESQATGLLSGQKPSWDFAATFKISVDDFLLRYFATDVVTLELNMASHGDFSLLARCAIPLSGMLRSKPVIKLANHPMFSVSSGEVVAHINADFRLAIPVSELYRLFLERHPQERRHIEDLSTKRVIESQSAVELAKSYGTISVSAASKVEDESRLYNELEIAIIKAVGLPHSADGSQPTAYVHFQFLGNPDKFTNPVPNTVEPAFNERFVFPMVTTDQQLRLLQRSKLQLTLIDMKGEELDDANEGLIGEAFIALGDLAEGMSLMEVYNVKNKEGKKVADLQISMRWKNTFRKQRELGPRALSGVEVETLISAFSGGEQNEGVVDYRAFCRFIDPPHEVRRSMEKLRSFCSRICDQDNRTPRDVFRVVLGDESKPVDEESFRVKMLQTPVDVLPMDFTHLFKFIDMDEDGCVTLDQFLAVLNLDEVAAIPPALQEKLRERTRDLETRRMSPMRMFEEADQWGPNGLVTRLEFKGVMKRMGFNLADEPDSYGEHTSAKARAPNYQSLLDRADTIRSSRGMQERERGGGRDGGARRGGDEPMGSELDVLNDTIESDDILVPADAGGHRDRLHSQQQDRERFERQRQDLMQRAGLAAQARKKVHTDRMEAGGDMSSDGSASRSDAPPANVGKNLLDTDSGGMAVTPGRNLSYEDPYDRQHEASFSAHGPSLRIPDRGELDRSATKVQSVYRGRLARKILSPSPTGKPAARPPQRPPSGAQRGPRPGSASAGGPKRSDGIAAAVAGGTAGAAAATGRGGAGEVVPSAGIMAAEDAIRTSLANLEGAQPVPNVLGGFQTVDSQRSGLVTRQQFAHVIAQFKAVGLYGADLRACMEFFDKSEDGSQIDYNAFVRFLRYREPIWITPVRRLHKLAFHTNSILKFRQLDSVGTGCLKRSDMLHTLAEMGFGQISQSLMLSMLQLFETRVDGQVNYGNMVEYVRENGVSALSDILSLEIFHMAINDDTGGSTPGDKAIMDLFKAIDSDGTGRLTVHQLAEFVDRAGLQAPKESIMAVFSAMDIESDGLGVRLHSFKTWLLSIPSAASAHAALYSHLSTAEVQRKANAYMLAVAAAPDANLDELSQSYLVYDWHRPAQGAIDKALFARATQRAGFPFTAAEVRMISAEFSQGNTGKVSYKRFLAWATPSTDSVVASSRAMGETMGAPTPSKKTVGAIIKFLETALQRGVDLLSVFGRYDKVGTAGVGRISTDDFCAAFSDLGLSSVTKREALDLADRFKAAAGDFIMYRRVVTELLRQVDDVTGAAEIDVIDTVRSALLRAKVDTKRLRDLFDYYDRTGSGRVKEEDLGTIFEEAKVRLKKQEVEAVADRFAVGSSGWVQFTGLLAAVEARMGERSSSARPRITGLSEDLGAKMKGFFESLIIRGKDFRMEFDKFDDRFMGAVTQIDFREVIQERLRAGLASKELEVLENLYRDPNDPRKISHVKLIHDLHPRHYGQSAAEYDASEEATWELAEKLRQKVRRRCEFNTPGELRKPFRHFARRRGDPGVTPEDFSIAVRDLGLRVAGDQERALFDMVNISGGKQFQFVDFAVFIRDPQHHDVIWKVRRLMARARVSEREVIDALTDQDTNASGILTMKQFGKAMKACNIDLSEDDLQRLMTRFDSEESQRFEIKRFVRFLRGRPHSSAQDSEGEEDDPDIEAAERRSGSAAKKKSAASAEETETAAWAALRERIEDKLDAGFTTREVFGYFEAQDTGTVDLMSLQLGARELGVPLSRPDARSILRRMGVMIGGPINRGSFFSAMEVDDELLTTPMPDKKRPTRRRGSIESERDDDGGGSDEDAAARRRRRREVRDSERDDPDSRRRSSASSSSTPEALVTLREQVEVATESKRVRTGDSAGSMLILALDLHGKERPGFVSQRELSRAIDSLHVSAAPKTILRVFDAIDTHVSGFIKNTVLVERMFPDGARDVGRAHASAHKHTMDKLFRRRPDLLEIVNENLTRLAQDSRLTIDDLFKQLRRSDVSDSGFLERGEFARCLRQFGFEMRKDVERDLVDSLGEGASGIDYEDFVDSVKKDINADTQADDALERLRKRISREIKHGADMEKLFNSMDRDGSGEIDVDEFEAGLDRMGIPLTRGESKRVISKFSRNGTTIKFRDFVKAFNPAGASALVDVVIERIRLLLEAKLGSVANSARKLKQIFADMDENGDGRISHSEFKGAMVELKLDLTRDEVNEVIKHFDKSNSGFLDYQAFMDLVGFARSRSEGGGGGVDSVAVLDDVLERLRKRISRDIKHGTTMEREFSAMDLDGNGQLDITELETGLDKLGIPLSRDESKRIMERFASRTGAIKFKDFIKAFSPGGVDERSYINSIVDRIRHVMEERIGSATNVARRMKEVFAEMDMDGDGRISHAEFKRAMKELRVELSHDETAEVMKHFDKNGDGDLEYGEFIDLIGFKPRGGAAGGVGERGASGRSPHADDEAVLDDVLERLRKRISRDIKHGTTMEQEFSAMDRDGNGQLDLHELEEGMVKMGIPLSRDESKRIMERFASRTGAIKFKDFIKAFSPGGIERRDYVEAIIDRIRHVMEERIGSATNVARRMKEVFAEMDMDGDGRISHAEFKRAMKELRVEISHDEAADVMRHFDKNGDGDIEYNEFMELVGFKPSSARRIVAEPSPKLKETTDEILRNIRRKLEDYMGSDAHSTRKIKQIFAEMDRDNSGTIDQQEFTDAMEMLRVRLRSNEVAALFERFDKDRTNSIDYNEFLVLIGFKR